MTAISKNLCFDVLNDIVDKYNNTYQKTIKMKPIDVKDNSFAEYNEESNEKDPKFKVCDHVRISKYKNIFAKEYAPNWSEEIFVIEKIKNTVPWTYIISDLNNEKVEGSFYEKELQKTNQKEFRIEKIIKRKGNKLYVKWKGYNNSFNSWTDKKRSYKVSQCFPAYRSSRSNIKVELDLSNYATKADIKNVTHVDVSSFALKTNLSSLKTEIDKQDIDKLLPVPNDLAKLSNVVKNDVVKKTDYDGLVTKVNNIDATRFVLNTRYDTDIGDVNQTLKKGRCVASKDDLDTVKNKIPNVSGFLLASVFNSKITEVENKIPDIKNLASKTEVTAVENKIPDVSNLLQKLLKLKMTLSLMQH